MNFRRIAVVAAIVLVVGGGAAFAVGAVGAPSVEAVDNRFADVNETTTLVETNLTIDNPNPIGIDAGGTVVDYTVEIGGVEMAAGQRRGISVGSGSQTLSFLTAMSNERIPEWWTSHVGAGEESTLRVHVDAQSSTLGQGVSVTPVERPISTDVLSSFNSTDTREIDGDLPLVEDPVLYVNETAAWWGSVSSAESPMEMHFAVYNPKQVPYTVTAIGYDVSMNDVPMGQGETDREYVLEPKTTTTIRATTVLENDRLDDWWITHLENDQVTDLRIDFYAVVELPTGDTARIPLEEIAHTETIETDIFGNEGSPGADTSTADPSGDETPNEDATETASTETEAADATTEDSGLLPTGTEETATDGGANETTDDGIL